MVPCVLIWLLPMTIYKPFFFSPLVIVSQTGFRPLHIAAKVGNADAVALLLDSNAQLEPRTVGLARLRQALNTVFSVSGSKKIL